MLVISVYAFPVLTFSCVYIVIPGSLIEKFMLQDLIGKKHEKKNPPIYDNISASPQILILY